ncbi:MAG: hypothetical protein HZA58_00790 [Acidimicrobiia bacterium]|nr:hypothetical protein [Acidimicrobiia bacterium]
MTVIAGEGRVAILYGHQPMASPPHHTGYLARPDVVDRHPGVVITAGAEASNAVRTLARYIARHGFAAVVPPGSRAEFTAAIDALGGAWGGWSRRDRRAVIGIGLGSSWAIAAAEEHGLPLVLLSPQPTPTGLSGASATLVLGVDAPGTESSGAGGHWVTYRGSGLGFWDDASADYVPAAAADSRARLIAFLDRHLAIPTAA